MVFCASHVAVSVAVINSVSAVEIDSGCCHNWGNCRSWWQRDRRVRVTHQALAARPLLVHEAADWWNVGVRGAPVFGNMCSNFEEAVCPDLVFEHITRNVVLLLLLLLLLVMVVVVVLL